MKFKNTNFGIDWRRLRESTRFHNVLLFLIFVAIATVFWFIIALNDSVTETFKVRLQIVNVPDTVTFITDPPADVHVTLRDKGTNILRSGVVKKPVLILNFRDYARDGIFRLTAADISSELKSDLGGVASISSFSLDSLRLYYTTSPGKRVPVIVSSDVTASSGYLIPGKPVSLTRFVKIYSYGNQVDTVNAVRTQRLIKKNLSQTTEYDVRLEQISGVKIVPSQVKVRVTVEPLVHKEEYVTVDIVNVPADENLLLFPNRVPVSFFVPMSRFNDDKFTIRIVADYNDVKSSQSSHLPLHVAETSGGLINVELKTDSVEYTIVKH